MPHVTKIHAALRIAHIVEWDRSGQSCIALIRGREVLGRFGDWAAARAAYRAAIAKAAE